MVGIKRKELSRRNSAPRFKVRIRESFYKDISSVTLERIKKFINDKKTSIVSVFYDRDKSFKTRKLKEIMNAMNINNETPINDKIAILIGVLNYSKNSKELANIHKNHCIAAYKIDDTLYCLDPWGKDMKNISLSIFYQLQKITKCKNIFIYKGKNLQQFDKTGVCVGLSSNFLMNMGKRKQKLGFETKDIPVNRKEYSRLLKESRYDNNTKIFLKKIIIRARHNFYDRYMYYKLSKQSLKEIESNLSKRTVTQKIKIVK